MDYKTVTELVEAAEKNKKKISEIVLEEQVDVLEQTESEIYNKMEERLAVMEASIKSGKKKNLKSMSGLTGGDGYKMAKYAEEGLGGIMGEFVDKAVARALCVSELNAAMGKIVASPTAGSCGIMPGCLVSLMHDKNIPKKDIVMSMFTAAGIGMVIANRASLAGATGGCQAECGSAAAMTAAAVVEALGGSPRQCIDAAAIALKNQMGLVCDPVAGLVEIPCIKRNAQGVVTAFCAADMALAGIHSHIPLDEVITAMKNVGNSLPASLKETAGGGLAATPTGLAMKEHVFGKKDM